MSATLLADPLAPLERLRLRQTLQDLWRDQARRITLLSLAMDDDPDAEEPTPLLSAETDPAATQAALAAARARLLDLEAAMRRLDEHSVSVG